MEDDPLPPARRDRRQTCPQKEGDTINVACHKKVGACRGILWVQTISRKSLSKLSYFETQSRREASITAAVRTAPSETRESLEVGIFYSFPSFQGARPFSQGRVPKQRISLYFPKVVENRFPKVEKSFSEIKFHWFYKRSVRTPWHSMPLCEAPKAPQTTFSTVAMACTVPQFPRTGAHRAEKTIFPQGPNGFPRQDADFHRGIPNDSPHR